MVSRFRRTLSFPKPITNRTSLQEKEKSYHVRSISLPCRSHPLISQLKDEINDLKKWKVKADERTTNWLCDGLVMLKNLHESFDDLLQLPTTQEAITPHSDWVEGLLEEFLRFVDVYGIFRGGLVGLKEEVSNVQVAIRRRDEGKVGLYLKGRKKMAKEMNKLVSKVRCTRRRSCGLEFGSDVELAGVLKDVSEATVSVTVAMLKGVSGSSMENKACVGLNFLKKKSEKSEEVVREVELEKLRSLRKLGNEEMRMVLKKLQGMESSIGRIESESQRVFRSLINTRVSLLNIITQ